MSRETTNDPTLSVKAVPFTGKQENFDEWEKTFLAVAGARNFAPVLTNESLQREVCTDLELLLEKKDDGRALTDLQIKITEKNNHARAALLSSFYGVSACKDILDRCASKTSAYAMWREVLKKYRRTDTSTQSLSDLEEQEQALHPSSFESPQTYIDKYLDVTSRKASIDKKYEKDDREKKVWLMKSVPGAKKEASEEEKNCAWSSFKLHYDDKKFEETSWEDFKSHFEQTWEHLGNPGNFMKASDEKNKAYSATTMVRKQKKDLSHIKCWKCEEKGHYARDCPANQNGSDNDSDTEVGGETMAAVAFSVTVEARPAPVQQPWEGRNLNAVHVKKVLCREDWGADFLDLEQLASESEFSRLIALDERRKASRRAAESESRVAVVPVHQIVLWADPVDEVEALEQLEREPEFARLKALNDRMKAKPRAVVSVPKMAASRPSEQSPVTASEQVETAAEQLETVVQSVETATEQPETVVKSVETATEQPETIVQSVETETVDNSVERAAEQPDGETVDKSVETAGEQLKSVDQSLQTNADQLESAVESVETNADQMSSLAESVETAAKQCELVMESVETNARDNDDSSVPGLLLSGEVASDSEDDSVLESAREWSHQMSTKDEWPVDEATRRLQMWNPVLVSTSRVEKDDGQVEHTMTRSAPTNRVTADIGPGDDEVEDRHRKFVGKVQKEAQKVLAIAPGDDGVEIRPGEEHWKALARLMSYLKSRKKSLGISAPREWNGTAVSDSDVGNKNCKHGERDYSGEFPDCGHDGGVFPDCGDFRLARNAKPKRLSVAYNGSADVELSKYEPSSDGWVPVARKRKIRGRSSEQQVDGPMDDGSVKGAKGYTLKWKIP